MSDLPTPEGSVAVRKVRCEGAILLGYCVLIIRHQLHGGGEGYWLLPGGGLEAGESEEACVEREMREETGLTVRVDRLLLDDEEPDPQVYERYKTYLCHPLAGEAQPGYEPEVEASSLYSIAQVAWLDMREPQAWPEDIRADGITYPRLLRVRAALGYL